MLKAEWTNRDALDCGNMTCANCQYNDGMVYTSMPPQYKCTITNEFHHNNDKCDVEFFPIKHGHWINDKGIYKCTACNDLCLVAGWAHCIPEKQMYEVFKFCPNCGAKMDEVEE